ncbi:MAG TPA: hypothetical protein VJT31_12310 [Rugosimonospora sp.]|nr:hypothetical protein [Rugosimonospora sp.]
MKDTTIKVPKEVRDRLAQLAAERDTSIGELISEFATTIATREELAARHEQALAVIRKYFVPDFNEEDMAKGEQMWRDLEAGRLTSLR